MKVLNAGFGIISRARKFLYWRHCEISYHKSYFRAFGYKNAILLSLLRLSADTEKHNVLWGRIIGRLLHGKTFVIKIKTEKGYIKVAYPNFGQFKHLHIIISDQFLIREYEADSEYIPQEGEVVIDVGAHTGLYSLKASKYVGNTGTVVPIEPHYQSYQLLLTNIALNTATNIKPLRTGLHDKEDCLNLYITSLAPGASTILEQHARYVKKIGHSTVGVVKIPVTTLDKLIFEILKLESVDLLKMDVEGAELAILHGARQTLSKGIVKKWVIEVHTDVNQVEDITKLLKHHGYKISRIFNELWNRTSARKAIVYAKRRY
ncbi:MAG: FkbM family methyltransferase [archaeon]|nr:FkbM family methyltransferase [archaeon]